MEFLLYFSYRVYTPEHFPVLWHQSIVIPILKPGKDYSLPRNFLEDIQGLSPFQFGFCRFRSIAERLLRLKHNISATLENSKFILAIFFDLQKEYHTRWKSEILHKLLSLGSRRHLPNFIKILLINRTFRCSSWGHPLSVF